MTSLSHYLGAFIKGEERPGLLVYGIGSPGWAEGVPPLVGAGYVEAPRYVLVTDHAHVLICTLAVTRDDVLRAGWPGPLDDAASVLLGAGAVAVWWMLEGAPYADPPGLFDPEVMDRVLGWRTGDRATGWPPLEEPVTFVSEESVAELRRLTAGLSDRD